MRLFLIYFMNGKLIQLIDVDGEEIGLYLFEDENIKDKIIIEKYYIWYDEHSDFIEFEEYWNNTIDLDNKVERLFTKNITV